MNGNSFGLKRKTSYAIILCCALFLGEYGLDKIFGDGDGTISNYGIHKIFLAAELILVFYLILVMIRSIYKNLLIKSVVQRRLMIAGKIFAVFLILLSSFIFLEMASRLFFPADGTYDRLYPVENARKPFPYVMFKGAPGTKTGFGDEVYNENGYRGKYPVSPKDSFEFRIIMMGGSAVWEGDPSIPQLLEKTFYENEKTNARVYNFGVVGANSQMELATLTNEIISLQPDVIIFYDGANDITHPLQYDPRPGYPFNFLVYENNPFLMRTYPALVLMVYKSNLIRMLARDYFAKHISKIDELRKQSGYGSEGWRNKIASVYINNINKASSIAGAFNARSFVFFQPMVYFKNTLSGNENNFIKDHAPENKHTVLVHKKIPDYIHQPGGSKFIFRDLSGLFENDPAEIFRDNVHTLQDAKEKIAMEIYTTLQSGMNNKPESASVDIKQLN